MSNKLTLIINSQQEADDNKTAAYPRRRPRRLGRRRLSQGLKFYDLGYQRISEGIYRTLEYLDPYRDDPLTLGTELPFFSINDVKPLDLTRVQALNDLIFAVPINEWKDNFHLYDDTYMGAGVVAFYDGLRINWRGTGLYFLQDGYPGVDDVFVDGTFRPPSPVSDDSELWWMSRILGHIIIEASTPLKITAENDYSATAVTDFVLAKQASVYCFPVLCRPWAWMDYSVPDNLAFPNGPGVRTHYMLGLNFALFPREVLFDAGHDYYDLMRGTLNGTPNILATNFGSSLNGMDSNEYDYLSRGVQYIQDNHPYFARIYTAVSDGSTATWSYEDVDPSLIFPNDYYTEGAIPPNLQPANNSTAMKFNFDPAQYCEGQLLAVINQAGQYYYIWASDDFFIFN